jgi:hypothetical protein
MTKVTSETDVNQPRILAVKVANHLERAIAAAIVNQNNLDVVVQAFKH